MLVVDDDYFNVLAAQDILFSTFTFESAMACSGRAAIELMQTNRSKTCCDRRITLVFMDLNMPGFDGYQTTEAILENVRNESAEDFEERGIPAHTAQVPPIIVALTSYDGEEALAKCLSYGMVAKLTKPLNPD